MKIDFGSFILANIICFLSNKRITKVNYKYAEGIAELEKVQK